MKKILLSLLGLVLLASFAGTLYFLWAKSQEDPVVYETNNPFVASIVKKTVATGSVVPRKEIAIKPQVSGIVDKVYVEPGQVVTEGDLVAKVTIIPNMASLSAAENRLNRSRISLENAQTEYNRNRQLFQEGVVSEASFKVWEIELKNAKEEVAAAEDNLAVIREGARKKSAYSTNTLVKATSSGMVLEVPVEEGDSVIEANTFNDGTTIAAIADMDEMIFEGKVDESEVGNLQEGMELLLTVGAVEKEQFRATLEYIAPKGVEEEGAIQFEIRAAMDLKENVFIRANYSANADIVLDKREDVLAIQESWLQFDDDGTFVEVETGDQDFEARRVETGLSDGIVIEVLDGLTEEDRIKDLASA
ncbi:MAG: efflux RND transporter periplasmic adaptor subunit [Acidobacteriota bacterium]|nr:efflux RND transporter periplasmic adaptor subunit [Acidobacteriota bacterium]